MIGFEKIPDFWAIWPIAEFCSKSVFYRNFTSQFINISLYINVGKYAALNIEFLNVRLKTTFSLIFYLLTLYTEKIDHL